MKETEEKYFINIKFDDDEDVECEIMGVFDYITLVNKYRHLCRFMLYWFHENNKPKNSIL